MADVLVALGGNMGDVRASFARAIPIICQRTDATLLGRSFDYRTPPWGDERQPAFINACIRIDTPCEPRPLLSILLSTEREFGRDRTMQRRWGPRPLDLDLLVYGDLVCDEPDLTLPHPRLFERAFVLVPLADIAPDRLIAGRTVKSALAGLSTEGIERLRQQ